MARSAGDVEGLAHALRHVADLARELGRLPEALAAGEEAVGLLNAADGGRRLDLANALALEALGRRDDARTAARPSPGRFATALFFSPAVGERFGILHADGGVTGTFGTLYLVMMRRRA